MVDKDLEKYIENKIDEFKKDLITQIKEKTKEKENKSIWDLDREHPETYYIIDSSGDIYRYMFNSTIDEEIRLKGNAFLTQEEAEFEIERRKVEAIMRKYSRPFNYGKSNYLIFIDNKNNVLINRWSGVNYGAYYFETRKIAEQVINEIGEERLKKYWFRVDE